MCRHTGQTQCPLPFALATGSEIEKKVFGVFAFFGSGDKENFSFAVFETRSELNTPLPRRLLSSTGYRRLGSCPLTLLLCTHRFKYLLECLALRISEELLALMGHLL
ncbi:hypothetical protein D3C75_657220 [compost metagenome]